MPTNWTITDTPLGKEIIFTPARSGAAFLVPLAASGITAALCSYGLYSFIAGWMHGEEILPAGGVFMLILVGGLFLAKFWYQHAFRSFRYILGGSTVSVFTKAQDMRPAQSIEKSSISEIAKVYTPPSEAGLQGTWRTAIVQKSQSGGRHVYTFLEGFSEEECNWLSEILASWAAVPSKVEDTTA